MQSDVPDLIEYCRGSTQLVLQCKCMHAHSSMSLLIFLVRVVSLLFRKHSSLGSLQAAYCFLALMHEPSDGSMCKQCSCTRPEHSLTESFVGHCKCHSPLKTECLECVPSIWQCETFTHVMLHAHKRARIRGVS